MTTIVDQEVEVLEAALAELSRPRGYTAAAYHQDWRGDNVRDPKPGYRLRSVGDLATSSRHCAVGGVEHAVWKITGEDVRDAREQAKLGRTRRRARPYLLYARVMRRLNRHARDVPPHRENPPYGTVEELSVARPKRYVLGVFERALAEARGEAGS